MNEFKRALNDLYEKRRDAQRKLDKAVKVGDRIGQQRWKKEVARYDGAIRSLEEK